MKRVYRSARASPTGDGFVLLLDGRPARTPLRARLTTPGAALAHALAAEWAAQTETVQPLAMPLTRIACAAIDRTRPHRAAAIDGLVAYGETDLLCYRADGPGVLVDRQAAHWDPIVDWARDLYNAPLRRATGVFPTPQPAQALIGLRAAVDGCCAWTLAGLSAAVDALGSLLLGLALVEGRLDAAGAFAAARIDEGWQRERWGPDEEADARAETLRGDVDAAARFLALIAAPDLPLAVGTAS